MTEMTQGERTSRAIMFVAVTCAVITTGLVVRRELFLPNPVQAVSAATEIPDWERLLAGGRVIGDIGAPVTIIEFTDYECPVCRHFARNLWPAVVREYEGDVSLVIRHWPLSRHKHALAAARAAECAAAQGRFDVYHELLFAQQDSIGIKPYTSFARESAVPDLDKFRKCSEDTTPLEAIETGIADAKALGARGTPAILINGLLLPGAPDTERFMALVESALAKSGR